MPVFKPLRMTDYLSSHPQHINVTFSFPDGRQLGANRMILSAACEAFEAMLSGNWKEETIIHLPDTNKDAFELFTKILYSESVDLGETDIFTIDQLYYLADKYMVEEIKVNIAEAAKEFLKGFNWDRDEEKIEDLSLPGICTVAICLLEHIYTDIKEILAEEIISNFKFHLQFQAKDCVGKVECLGCKACLGNIREVKDLLSLVKFFCLWKFSEPVKEGIVEAANLFIDDLDKVEEKEICNMSDYVLINLPEIEGNVKFLFKVMKLKGLMKGKGGKEIDTDVCNMCLIQLFN